ncbi:hypothetical protein [Arthrobacter sp. SD76]|uniref:hypothetical protein n=1 Tax=Arthrobacter sp. SD76 TaxID=3415007 RepID=UPI003C77A6FB
MFMYFPDNYVWSMSVAAILNSGGLIDEVDRACRPLLEASRSGDDGGTEKLYESWNAVATELIQSAEFDDASGHRLTAGQKYYRAGLYLTYAERLQSPTWAGRDSAYQETMDLLLKSAERTGVEMRRVEVPYGDSSLPGYFVAAAGLSWSCTCNHSVERLGLNQGDVVLYGLCGRIGQARHIYPRHGHPWKW